MTSIILTLGHKIYGETISKNDSGWEEEGERRTKDDLVLDMLSLSKPAIQWEKVELEFQRSIKKKYQLMANFLIISTYTHNM